ncbi:sugar transferase [Finegoldia magna]|uniref:sugar transferase n=2 Tax=Finegoldia TaxID=150022 RepID=UPI002915DDD2|nr:sugar transferase [Finegoldia magna]
MKKKYELLNKKMRWKAAEMLAKDRLDIINSNLDDVEVKHSIYSKYVKRLLDIIISLVALVLSLPINIVIGLLTIIDVGRPIIFKQKRLGLNGKEFTIYKFRNMTNEKDEYGELLPANERITRFGSFVRRTSLDELLNFWSIFKGDMSIIGPRPLPPEYHIRFNKRHLARLSVKPGLECPLIKQTNSVWTWDQQFDNDVWYVENVSFKVDLLLLIALFKFAFNKSNSIARAKVQRGIFMGYDLNGKVLTLENVPEYYLDEVLKSEGK